jgi:hypothetical protein
VKPADGGAERFARFAFPPNLLGHCGPQDHDALWGYASGQAAPDGGLSDLARTFEGAWPYLTLLAGAAHSRDPLADEVVRAYWLGGPLLDRVAVGEWGWHLHDRFAGRVGGEGRRALDGAVAGGRPSHAFHVLCVYPWTGLLRRGVVDGPLDVLDRCRIRWGRVERVRAGRALVRSGRLEWADGRLVLGAPVLEEATIRVDGRGLVDPVGPGDLVALHWDWVCERLSPVAARHLAVETAHHLAIANGQGVGVLS